MKSFSGGYPDGDFFEWYENGKLKTKSQYKMGERHGYFYIWTQKGDVYSQRYFQNDFTPKYAMISVITVMIFFDKRRRFFFFLGFSKHWGSIRRIISKWRTLKDKSYTHMHTLLPFTLTFFFSLFPFTLNRGPFAVSPTFRPP